MAADRAIFWRWGGKCLKFCVWENLEGLGFFSLKTLENCKKNSQKGTSSEYAPDV